jgi:hypothetical protein
MSVAFAPVHDLIIETVDSVCGSRKTLTAIAVALDRARTDSVKTLVAMPTLQLIGEMSEVARRQSDVPVTVITSGSAELSPPAANSRRPTTTKLLSEHLSRTTDGGELVFTTHETLHRVAPDWPEQAARYDLVIDEAPEVILSRAPFRLYENRWALTSFLELGDLVTDSPGLRRARRRVNEASYAAARPIMSKRDQKIWQTFELILANGPDYSSAGEYQQAQERIEPLRAKAREAAKAAEQAADDGALKLYSELKPVTLKRVSRRVNLVPVDDVYRLLQPVPAWVLQGCPVFTEWEAWVLLVAGCSSGPIRGQVSICGFRRPDALRRFARVTILGALLRHSLTWAVWEALGVRFEPSQLIRLNQNTTLLGPRRLRIYWLSDGGWSKRLRDRSGGITTILDAVVKAAVMNPSEPLCVVVNKDDGSEDNPEAVRKFFPMAQILPHRVEGQNRFRHCDQLVHCAALNSWTPDIRFLEAVLGIDAREQRIARTGAAVYQALMRLSLRDPTAKRDVTLVVMDKDVAEWLTRWFTPADQVEVASIDADVVRKGRPGRPRKELPLTNAQRQQRWRDRRRDNAP